MAPLSKLYVIGFSLVMSVGSNAVASLDANMWELETPLFETIQEKARAKMAPCEKLDFYADIEYRDCLIDAAMFALSAREKNDRIKAVFELVFSKIDTALQPGAAMKVAENAINGYNSEHDVNMKSTYYEILKNLMDRLPQDKEDFRPIFQKIKDAKIEVSEDVVTERKRRMGLQTASLTDRADFVLGQKLSNSTIEVSE